MHEAPRPAYLLHMDCAGPFRVATRSGRKYMLLVVDDYSRRCFVFLLRLLSEFFPEFKCLVTRLEAEFGSNRVVAQTLTDGGSYFKSQQVRDFCLQRGIYQIFSPPYTPSLNGVAERHIRTIVEMARTMLIHASAPTYLYGEAVKYAAFILNRCLRRYSDGTRSTPMERWSGRQQPRAHLSLKVFGCAAWATTVDGSGHKLGKKAQGRFIFIGISDEMKGYRLARLPSHKVTTTAHATFNESLFPCAESCTTRHKPQDYSLEDPSEEADVDDSTRPRRTWTPSNQCLRNIATNVVDDTVVDVEYVLAACMADCIDNAGAVNVPKSHQEAMAAPNAAQWRDAERSEFRSHQVNGTFGPPLDAPPPGFKAIECAYVYKVKQDGRLKVRVVMKGYLMQAGIDYNETFAPVVRVTSIRLMLAIAAKHDLELHLADCKTAFLTADMDAEVYITLPPAFNDDEDLQGNRKSNSATCCRMLKAIPGCPQGSRLFNEKLHAVITDPSLGDICLQRYQGDYCLYFLPGRQLYLVVWVDDLLFAVGAEEKPDFDKLLAVLKANFDLHLPAGPVSTVVGVNIRRDRARRTLTLDQEATIDAILAKAGMTDCRPADTPVSTSTRFTKEDCPSEPVAETKWYRSILASCIYLATWTRPDICFAVSKLSKFMANPGSVHVRALKRLLRFLKGSRQWRLRYDFTTPQRSGVYGYYDAAHLDDVDTSRSTMAYVFFFEGCPIAWKSKVHTFITTSTNHSEYVASAKAAKEATWLYNIAAVFGLPKEPVALFSDSQGAIAMAYNPVNHTANKHIDLADHYTREQVERRIITITYMPTKQMVADVLTKAKSAPEFLRLVSFFMYIIGRNGLA
jgi:hypothetical protein